MSKHIPILLIEDNDIDVEIVERTFRKAKIENPVVVVEDGIEALAVLNGTNAKKISHPCLILVDINMPRMDGFTFLEALRDNELLNKNVAFMLTTSNRPKDIEKAYTMNVAGYILKDDIDKLGALLSDYIDTNQFPTGQESYLLS